jgi:hypothetical protein
MSREAHVRICESLGVRFPWATRRLSFVIQNLTQHIHRTSWYFRNYSQPSMDSRHRNSMLPVKLPKVFIQHLFSSIQ